MIKKKQKEFFCPHCGKNLKELGFRTEETAWKTFDWQWKKNKGYFEEDDGEVDNSELNDIFCNACNEDIRDFIEDNTLI